MAREGYRFEFGWLGILGMLVVFTAGSAVIFFLGIYVGKGLQESRLAREERVVRLPVSPPADGGIDAGEVDLRTYDRLAQSQPAATASVNLAVRSAVEPTPSPEPLQPTAAEPSPAAAISPPDGQPTVAAVVAMRSPAPTEQVARLEAPVPTARRGGKVWSVQVNATKDEATANRLVKRLDEIGYDAFIVRVRLANETWYRVRVGRFPTMEAATAVVMRLKNEERYSRAFLVNE